MLATGARFNAWCMGRWPCEKRKEEAGPRGERSTAQAAGPEARRGVAQGAFVTPPLSSLCLCRTRRGAKETKTA